MGGRAPTAGDVPETVRWSGAQGVFPIANRGWAYAGYQSEGTRARRRSTRPRSCSTSTSYPGRRPSPPASATPAFPDVVAGATRTPSPRPCSTSARARPTSADPRLAGSKEACSARPASCSPPARRADQADLSGGAGVGSRQSAPGQDRPHGADPRARPRASSALSGSFGAGPSFGLLDYVDMNGDSFPDFVGPEKVSFTGPTGGYLGSRDLPLDGPGVGADMTFAVSGGFGGSAIDIKGNSTGDANTPQGAPQNAAPAAAAARRAPPPPRARRPTRTRPASTSAGGLGIGAQFTNPVSAPAGSDAELEQGRRRARRGQGGTWEWELADVNGDGLPDRVAAGPGGVRVQFNLGYSFSDEVAVVRRGRSRAARASPATSARPLGFNYNNKEFSGGLAAQRVRRPGPLDLAGRRRRRRARPGEQGRPTAGITVAFGSGAGRRHGRAVRRRSRRPRSTWSGQRSPSRPASSPRPAAAAASAASVDFTIPIGPLCLPAPLCYIIVNPGGSYERSLSSTRGPARRRRRRRRARLRRRAPRDGTDERARQHPRAHQPARSRHQPARRARSASTTPATATPSSSPTRCG